ncbi:hypothetical protein ACFX5F_13010 [Flavobacterium sp. ZS1P70]|uniref:Uncharacterized protein n=1 Tax=Flavobacterium zhoui TaxID=3230414 RepID=A0ABW6I8A5_9FLAO
MAEIVTINVDFSEHERKLIIPEKIEVKQFSIIQWNVQNAYRHLDFEKESLIFTLYFENESPFQWKRNFVQIGLPFFFPYQTNEIIRLAEDSADKKGDYKYGVKIESANSKETLFDEDPYLIVR